MGHRAADSKQRTEAIEFGMGIAECVSMEQRALRMENGQRAFELQMWISEYHKT